MSDEDDIPEEEQVAQDYYESLLGKSVEDILKEGQKHLFARLVARCRAGIAGHQEMAVLRNILKDNGLTLGIPPEEPQGRREVIDLPEFPEPDYHLN